MKRKDPIKWERKTLKIRFERDLFVALCGGSLFYAYLLKTNFLNDLLISLIVTIGLYSFYRWLHIGLHNKFKVYLKEFSIPVAVGIASMLYLKDLQTGFYLHLIASFVLCFFYNFEVGNFSIRKIPYIKSIFISLLWVWILVFLPLSFSHAFNLDLLYILIQNFLFILAMTIMYDIYDIEEDEYYGIKTLVNFKQSKYAVLSVILLLLLSNSGCFFNPTSGPNLIASVIGIILLLIYGRKSKSGLLLTWDGLILLKAILIIVLVR